MEQLISKDIRISMDGRGRAIDNVFIERLHRTTASNDCIERLHRTTLANDFGERLHRTTSSNDFIERLWRRVKYEEIYLHEYRDGWEAEEKLAHYFDFYCRRRPH